MVIRLIGFLLILFKEKMGIKVKNVHIYRFIWLIIHFVEQCSEYFWVLDRALWL